MKKTLFTTLATIALFLMTALLYPQSTFAQNTNTYSSVSGNNAVSGNDSVSGNDAVHTLITRLIISDITSNGPFEYDVVWNDTTTYGDIVDTMESLSQCYAYFYDEDENPDYFQPDIIWDGDGTHEGVLPNTLFVPDAPEYPYTLTYTGSIQPPEGYAFSEQIPASDRQITLTLHVYENEDSLPKIPLSMPADVTFYLQNGLYFAANTPVDNFVSDLTSFSDLRIYFTTQDDTEITPQITWNYSNVAFDTPGKYTITGTIQLSPQYTLPAGTQPLSMPIYIRDNSCLEIYLDSAYHSVYTGTSFSGTLYVPDEIDIPEGYIDAWYAYCGNDMPTKEQLSQITFLQDEDSKNDMGLPFFYATCYGSDSDLGDGSLTIDFSEMPDPDAEGWYAFYVEAEGLFSNYLLIDSRSPMTTTALLDGTRGGDANADFPTVEQTPPTNGQDDETQASSDSATTSFTEKEDENGVTLSGVRILALAKTGSPLVVTKSGATVSFSTKALEALSLKEKDFLTVTLTCPSHNELQLTVSINGVEQETLPELSVSLHHILYDAATDQTITHHSGTAMPCHNSNGHLAFTVTATGTYTVSVLPKEPVSSETVPPDVTVPENPKSEEPNQEVPDRKEPEQKETETVTYAPNDSLQETSSPRETEVPAVSDQKTIPEKSLDAITLLVVVASLLVTAGLIALAIFRYRRHKE